MRERGRREEAREGGDIEEVVSERERERGGERGRERHTDRHTNLDRQKYRQANAGYNKSMGQHGCGTVSVNGERLLGFSDNLVTGGTPYPHKKRQGLN